MIDAVVTGAGGFIGQRLIRGLKAAGINAFAVERISDICDADMWRGLPSAPVLFHLAGKSYVPESWSNSSAFMATNVVGTQNALDWCKRHGARMIFASAYVYGAPTRLPIQESDPVNPNNPYAVSKRLAEQLCEFAAAHEHVPVTALRIFNVYGAGQRPEFLIPTLISQVGSRSPINVMDLTPRRDFVYVDDVVAAFIGALRAPDGYNCLNIGSGISLSVQDIIDVIQEVCGTSLPVGSSCVARRNEILDVRADIGRAEKLIAWRPKWNFSAGIRAMITEL
ncbi:Putative nucleotide sugar dehydratase (plasmid) [Neorhizobium galegae bv. officinalis bv. officinalis str. HAMBI 1141]|uniref:Putative nucleotide sugar dehydratase n=1 Tax=Neorhizobium galegae bv. officinalis bv. officinalis str. HAMBI 1141 TaxID=1028801 RepID=A0A068TGX5_NEOGA|nr:NAD(P)-dependent oxidoreductase [Neorhizobium galegae]CDN57306.1 Putative nucleotide sugar dehydratase [Neorhizobium galegae bv. officinalis bv. officinalis str. HAMBI 1141]